ncbi:MAG: RsmE family RNA methyltransferase, partial [Treponemataceae bacterium]|nr:RsmE family RNA methyltransferase [Treponemataceae bacterium]
VALWQEQRAGTAGDVFAGVLYERTERTQLLHAALDGKTVVRAALAVGAEGGISPQEIAQLCAGGFVPIHFETNILRCETAALYGIAALQNAMTEKHVWQCRE